MSARAGDHSGVYGATAARSASTPRGVRSDERGVLQPFGQDHVQQSREHRDVLSRLGLQVDVGVVGSLGAARIDRR